jgi:glycosyltransferase involved in cell wall biosynthesis
MASPGFAGDLHVHDRGKINRMKIVLSNSSSRWGGVHKVTEILARGFQSRGHDVAVFGYPGKMLETRMQGIVPFEPILKGMDFNPVVLVRAAIALRRFRPDVVVALMKKDVTLTGIVAAALGIPVVVRHANQRPLADNLYWKKMMGDLPSLHITNAEATKRTLLESAPFLDASDIEVIYNGIDPQPYESAARAELGLFEGELAVGFIGSFEARKGLRELCLAWHEVSRANIRAHLFLVGKGSMESEMKSLLKGTSRVHWMGYRTDIAEILKSLDVLVLPSYVEGAPNVVLEAMCAETAVVATAVSGTPELVRDGIEARLVPARDASSLARAIIEILGDADLRSKLTSAGRARVVERFGLDRMIDEYEGSLERVCANFRARLPKN